jgi:hypothetical protein
MSAAIFTTRGEAMAVILSAFTSIQIERWATGYPTAPAPYIPGTSSGPVAFQDAVGNWWQLDISGDELDACWFGAGGGVDDTTALNLAGSYGSGKAIQLRAGNYFVSASVLTKNNTVWRGAGKDVCTISVVTGVDVYQGMIQGWNKGWITISGIHFHGNNVANLNDQVGAIWVGMDVDATQNVGPVEIRDCQFSNFKQDYWVKAGNANAAVYSQEALIVTDCVWKSVYGNSRSYSDPDGASVMLDVGGSAVNSSGSINRVVVSRNTVDGRGVAGFCQLWNNIGHWTIEDNDVQEVAYYITTTMNVYAFLCYTFDIVNPLNGGGIFRNNQIKNTIWGGAYVGPGAGHYCATTGPVISTGNFVSGITREDSASIRRAGLSYNGSQKLVCANNQTDSCAIGVAFSGPANQVVLNGLGTHIIAHNAITSIAGGSIGIHVSWTNSGTLAPLVFLDGNVIAVTATKVFKNPGTYGSIVEVNTQ